MTTTELTTEVKQPRIADPSDVADAQLKPPHEPALDGLRGLAVAAVFLFHLERLQGGFLGVDLFFVLSGFLITSLLVVERQRRGSIDLKAFWARRARRLFPALLSLIVGVSVLLLVLTEQSERARFRGDALATLGYVANWHRMGLDIGYWDIFSQPSPLDHTWSLAIEEQFYVVWPLLAVVVLKMLAGRVRILGLLAIGGAALSFALLAFHFSPVDTSRAYFGTDSRIGATLLGAALACLATRRPRRIRPPSRPLELAGLAGLVVMGWSMVTVNGLSGWYYQGGLAIFGLASVAVIYAVTGGPAGLLGRVLSWAPLRGLGIISYGVYLWHWPLKVFVTPERTHVDGVRLDAVLIGLTLVTALASFYLIERPIRRGALQGWSIRLATTGAASFTVVVALVATAGTPATAPSGTPTPTDAESAGLSRVPVEGSDNPYLLYPAEVPPGDARVLLVGDSGAYGLGPHLVEAAKGHQITVASSAPYNCNIANPEGVVQTEDGQIMERRPCQDERRLLWADLVKEFDPDAVVYYLANTGLPGRVRLGDDWARDCEEPFEDYLAGALTEEADLLTAGGATLYLATGPYSPIPDPDRIDCRNALYRDVAESEAHVDIVDMNGFVAKHVDAGEVDMFQDIVHLSPEGNDLVADWLLTDGPVAKQQGP